MKYRLHSIKKSLLIFAGLLLFLSSYAQLSVDQTIQKKLEGQWIGPLKVASTELRIAFNFHSAGDSLTVKVDSPDQGVEGIAARVVYFKDDSISIIVPQAFGRFSGHLNDSTMKGRWIQGTQNLPVILVKTDKIVKINRPQEQLKNVTYVSKDITFKNTLANIQLAGTLTIPDTLNRYPAVILITGSGPENRNEEVFGHKPFLVLADYLTRQGFAVLRYDDRGVGKSQGKFSTATTFDFALDAESALKFLKNQPYINPDKIGLIGHSEGGIIAYIVAAEKSAQVDFIVSLAGPSIPGDSLLVAQATAILQASGASAKKIQGERKLQEELFRVLKTQPNDDSAQVKMENIFRDFYKDSTIDNSIRANINSQIYNMLSPWFRKFISLDPGLYIAAVKCPVLALFGSKDLQVPAEINSQVLEHILKDNGNNNYKIDILPGLNHLFQHAETGLPSEYPKIEETFAPEALQVIGDWMKKVTGIEK